MRWLEPGGRWIWVLWFERFFQKVLELCFVGCFPFDFARFLLSAEADAVHNGVDGRCFHDLVGIVLSFYVLRKYKDQN